MYELDFGKRSGKKLYKLAKKDLKQTIAVDKVIKKILSNPYSFKPLKRPMTGQRRVQIGAFVLTYSINEKNKVVKILDYEHHDKVYKRN